MATASDYPITEGFIYDPAYPLNGGKHLGIDYGCPSGTPVVVNGTTIGYSGYSGYVVPAGIHGSHLHVGKWVAGQPQNPGNYGGFYLANASVYDTGSNATDGNYVRIGSGNAVWCYLHLSQINVRAGQLLPIQAGGKGADAQPQPVKEEIDMSDVVDRESIKALYLGILMNSPAPTEGEIQNLINNRWTNKGLANYLLATTMQPRNVVVQEWTVGHQALRDGWWSTLQENARQLADLRSKIPDPTIQAQLQALQTSNQACIDKVTQAQATTAATAAKVDENTSWLKKIAVALHLA